MAKRKGLWANIHAKRERIKRGSDERMAHAGEKGRPSEADFKAAAKISRRNKRRK
jgi:hypothetical protein